MHFGGSQTPRVLHPVPSFSINTDEMNGVWVTQTPHHQTRASASLRVRCFWDENGQDISCNIPHHFLHYLLIELIFADKSEIGTKYGMPNLKTGWKRFRCYPDRFLLFQFLFRISHFLRDLLYFICLKYWFYSGDGFWPSDCFERSKSVNSCFCTPQS